jgi:multiple sugar transport system permease protein
MAATPAPVTAGARPNQAAPLSARLAPHLTGWAFALPFLLLFLAFWALPIVASFVLSLTDFGITNLREPFDAPYIGLDNYSKLIHDELFWKSARNTAYFVVVGVPATIALGLVLAVGLNHAALRLKGLFRVGYYVPVVTSIVAVAVIWRYLYNPDVGLINRLLDLVGISGPNWLGDPHLAMPSLIALGVWRNFGFDVVIFLAALQAIDPTLYEAARTDGATAWQVFRRITLPLLRPALLFLTVLTTIGYLQVFEEPFVMTKGGPLNSTLTVSQLTYNQGFKFFHLGYASAISYALMVVIAVLAFLQFRLLRPQT